MRHLDDIPGLKLHKAAFLMGRMVEKELVKMMDISMPQFMVLMMVGYKDVCSQAEVARMRGLTEAAISRMTDGLVERKLLNKKANPQTRREHLLELTEEGKMILEKGIVCAKGVTGEVFSKLSPDEMSTLDRLMDKILSSVYTKPEDYA